MFLFDSVLNKIDTKYTLKIRSDCYFNSNKILEVNHKKYNINNNFKIFEERIITSSVCSLNQSVTSILYNFNDWFNFGLTKDLKKIWSNINIKEEDINYFKKNKFEKKNLFGKDWELRFTPEQYIYYTSVSKKIKNKIDNGHDFSKKKLFNAENYLINNFYLIHPDDIDFIFPKYDGNINKKINHLSTNLRSTTLMYLSYSENDWIKLFYKHSKIKLKVHNNFNYKILYFRLKFTIKKKIYFGLCFIKKLFNFF